MKKEILIAICACFNVITHAQIIEKGQSSGIYWPMEQAFALFTTPADTLDGFRIEDPSLAPEEKVMFTVLQGLVNKTKPSVYLLRPGGEGMYYWPERLGINIREYPADKKWDLLRKHKEKIDGVILYSVEKSVHYRNLANTVAGLKNALPVTATEYEQMLSQEIEFPVVADLSPLSYTAPEDIYRHLYDTYWKDCTKRMLISHNALVFIRDIAVASKAAVIWLDPRKEKENEVLRLFLKDMKAGESIILGWWAEERSGIGIGTEYGISTIPADFYENATVYAGMNRVINLPEVPKKPDLENKIYLAVFLSDGDNIQYCQHTMPRLWDSNGRGFVPVNWTVSPGLVDLGPQLLNYFYRTATPNDFLASGPSGFGYMLLYDAHNRKWFNTGGEPFDRYLQLTQTYLERSGLRVITVWDEMNEAQMESYATRCRYLYGATQQDWQKRPEKVPAFVKRDRLAFLPNYPCYAGSTDVFVDMNRDTIVNFDGSHPVFLTTQGVSWRMGPDSLVVLKEKLEKLASGKIVFCRGDHFFALYNEANRKDFNLMLLSGMKITSSRTITKPDYAADGTCTGERSWISTSTGGKKWIRFDFKKSFRINRYVIRHVGANGLDTCNTQDFTVEVSADGKKWITADRLTGNVSDVTDRDITPIQARYVQIHITDAGKDGIARIGDIEIYGSVIKRKTNKQIIYNYEKVIIMDVPFYRIDNFKLLYRKTE